MLVPRTRLLVWIALVVLPFAAVGATVPGALVVSTGLIGALFITVIFDAVLAGRTLRGLRMELPEVVRLPKDRATSLEVRVHHEAHSAPRLRIGFEFPPEITSEGDERTLQLPPESAASRMDWPLTASKRGQYFLRAVHLEAASPLGFWAVRSRQSLGTELRVYPDLRDERRRVAALFLRRPQTGVRAHRQAGQGRDFEKLREYMPGDGSDQIHWKASAKRGHPVTKVFQIERTQEVYVIVDASRLSARPAAGLAPAATGLERFIAASLILGLAAEQQGDHFGLVTFSDRVLGFVRAKSGQAHYDACRDRLYTLEPQPVTPDFAEVCSFLRLRLRKRALLIFLTALDDPMLAERFVKAVDLLSRQHLVLVDMLHPAGAHALFHRPDVAAADDLYYRLGGHLQWQNLRELEQVMRRRGVRFSLLDPQKLSAQIVAQHAEVKGRQWL